LAGLVGIKHGKKLSLALEGPTPLIDVLSVQAIPLDAVQLVMLNHQATGLDVVVKPGDRLALFPQEYSFFVDWNHFRNRKL
jgi:hypothetical protein